MPMWKVWAGRTVVLLAIELPWVFLTQWAEKAFGLRDGLVPAILQIAGIVLAVGLARALFPMPPRPAPE